MSEEQMPHEQILKELVERAATEYTCNRGPRPSGAILAHPLERFMLYGDVIPTAGSPSCKEVGCMMVDGHCVRNIHAEVDALLQAAYNGCYTSGAIMYSINKPCYNCTLACIKAGISKIYYAYAVYDEERTQAVIEASGIECIHVPIE